MLLYEKNIFFQNYIQYETGLVHHHPISIVNNGGSGVHNTDELAKTTKRAKEKTQYAVLHAQLSSTTSVAFILLNF